MFVKLLRQEWRSTRGVLGLLCIIILSSGAAIGGSGFYMAWSAEQRFIGNDSLLTALISILLMAAMMAIGICCAGGVFYFIWRFYQSRFTDEGYLTFTLPVTTHQNLLSSILNTILGCILIAIAALGAFLIALGLLILAYNQEIVWQDTFCAIRRVVPELISSFRNNWAELTALWISVVIEGVSTVVELMLSVTIGATIARRHKLLAAVGVLCGINLVQILVFIPQVVQIFDEENTMRLLTLPSVAGIVPIVAGYFLMYWLMDKKLNLN